MKDTTWYDVNNHTPEGKRISGGVLPVRVMFDDETKDILGWDGKNYWQIDGPIKPITHFQFLQQ